MPSVAPFPPLMMLKGSLQSYRASSGTDGPLLDGSKKMPSHHQDGSAEENGNGTPSTASRIRSAPIENAFPTPTPPRRQESRRSESQKSDRRSTAPNRLFHLGRSSPAPKEHKSVEVLRSNVSRGGSNGLSSASELEKSWQNKDLSKRNSQFFDQAFAVRPPYNSAKDRVARDSMIVVELRTSCCVCYGPQLCSKC